jgi:hypothetical protein
MTTGSLEVGVAVDGAGVLAGVFVGAGVLAGVFVGAGVLAGVFVGTAVAVRVGVGVGRLAGGDSTWVAALVTPEPAGRAAADAVPSRRSTRPVRAISCFLVCIGLYSFSLWD